MLRPDQAKYFSCDKRLLCRKLMYSFGITMHCQIERFQLKVRSNFGTSNHKHNGYFKLKWLMHNDAV